MLNIVGDKSFGILSIVPKDKNGDPVEDFESRIIYDNGNEVKEWIALNNYLKSFPKKDGKAQIDESYSKVQGVKIVNKETSLKSRLEKPNKISTAIVIIVLAVFIGLIFLIRFFVKKYKRKNKRF